MLSLSLGSLNKTDFPPSRCHNAVPCKHCCSRMTQLLLEVCRAGFIVSSLFAAAALKVFRAYVSFVFMLCPLNPE